MERAPRITSVNELEVLEERRRRRLREAAQRQAVEARKKAITALTLIRMMFQLAVTPSRQVARVVSQNARVTREARRMVSGDHSRVLVLGRGVLASRT